jgi:hypothetical protein
MGDSACRRNRYIEMMLTGIVMSSPDPGLVFATIGISISTVAFCAVFIAMKGRRSPLWAIGYGATWLAALLLVWKIHVPRPNNSCLTQGLFVLWLATQAAVVAVLLLERRNNTAAPPPGSAPTDTPATQ